MDLPPRVVFGVMALIVAFSVPLYQWFKFSFASDLYSYTLLVPVVSFYLFWVAPKSSEVSYRGVFRLVSAGLILFGVVIVAGYWVGKLSGTVLKPQDAVAYTTLPFVLMVAGISTAILDSKQLKRAIFPLVFLFFMVPFPLAMEHAIETFLQQGSAPPAYWLFQLVGTTIFRQDLVFQLPGITLQIAPECSGIRSTLVLFMVSLLAGHLFLRSPWKRVVLTVAVIPLALIRNGFRVFTIGQLCVSVGPHMIDSAIHHRGGPIFFALSLIPFFILVYFLVRSDRSATRAAPMSAPAHV